MATQDTPPRGSVSDFMSGLTATELRRADRFYLVALERSQPEKLEPDDMAAAAKHATLLALISIALTAAATITLAFMAAVSFLADPWPNVALVLLVATWTLAAVGVGLRYIGLRNRLGTTVRSGDAVSGSRQMPEIHSSPTDPQIVAPEMLRQMTRLERWSIRRWYLHRLSADQSLPKTGASQSSMTEEARRTVLNGIYYAGLIVAILPIIALPYGMAGLLQGKPISVVWTSSIGLILGIVLLLCVVRHRQVNRYFRRFVAGS